MPDETNEKILAIGSEIEIKTREFAIRTKTVALGPDEFLIPRGLSVPKGAQFTWGRTQYAVRKVDKTQIGDVLIVDQVSDTDQ